LERQGLVERQPHPTDRRAKLVATTPEGTAAAKRAEEILARLPVGLAGLSHEDMETLARILESARPPAPQGDRSPDGSTKTKTSR
jgi:DNA-binding MarR family transcriptional regulator